MSKIIYIFARYNVVSNYRVILAHNKILITVTRSMKTEAKKT